MCAEIKCWTKNRVKSEFGHPACRIFKPSCHIHHTETDWADLQACPADPQASCSLSAAHNAAGITQKDWGGVAWGIWEPTRGVLPEHGWHGGVLLSKGAGAVGLSGKGAENPLFNIAWSFQIREKTESGVLCHPATLGPLKSSLSVSQERCLLKRQKRGEE